jgi:hypothetical protein
MKYEEMTQRYTTMLICKVEKLVSDVIVALCAANVDLLLQKEPIFHVYMNKNCRSIKRNTVFGKGHRHLNTRNCSWQGRARLSGIEGAK